MNQEEELIGNEREIVLDDIRTEADTPESISGLFSGPTRHIPLFLSNYGWFIIILSFIGYGFFVPRIHPAQLYTSKESAKTWNSSSDPLIFTHTTDIHIAQAEPFKIINTRALVHTMKFYKPDFHLVSGDIVDNYGEKNWPKIGHQVREDWELWKDIWSNEGDGKEIIDVPGNHDMWGIIHPLSDENIFLDYSPTYNRSNTKTMKEFYARTIVSHGIKFVLVNVYRFPDVHPPYTYWAHPSKEILDYIEEEIEKAGECVVVTHYPVDHHWWIRSSKGHTFEEIMQFKNIRTIFSGHFHPIEAQIIHHKQGGVEFIGPGAFQFKAFGIVTVDNDRMVYHNVHLVKSPTKFFLTHPIPKEQLSSHQIFNEKKTEIRLISYAGKKVNIKITGDINGKMKFSRTLENGADLYTYPLELPSGEHFIHLEGDGCNISCDFYIGDAIKGKGDVAACYQRGLLITKFTSIPVFIALFIIWFPVDGLYLKNVEKWIHGESTENSWLSAIFAGPIIIRTRIAEFPKKIRIFMFLILLYPLIMPHHFFKPIHGTYGYSFLCFVVIGNNILYDEWALHFTYFYLLLFIMPTTMVLSSFKYMHKSWVFNFSMTLAILLLIGSQVVNYRWIGESVVIPLLFLNPSFVIVPLSMYTFLYYNIWYKQRKGFFFHEA